MDPASSKTEGTPPPRPEQGDDGEGIPAEPLATRTAPSALQPFGDVPLRPHGQRYGDADLHPLGVGVNAPGLGGASSSGGMLVGDDYFRGGPPGSAASAQNPANLFARYDPIMPGQSGPMGPGFGRAAPRAPPFPGEPDPDNLMPLHGGPRDPFGGPGGGQFGPGRSGGFGGGGYGGGYGNNNVGGGGGFSSW